MKEKTLQLAVIALFMGFVSTNVASAQTGPATQADIHRLEMQIQAIQTDVAQLKSTMAQHGKMGKGQNMMGKPAMGMQQQGMPMMDDDNMGGAPAQAPMGSGNQPQMPADPAKPMGAGMGHM